MKCSIIRILATGGVCVSTLAGAFGVANASAGPQEVPQQAATQSHAQKSSADDRIVDLTAQRISPTPGGLEINFTVDWDYSVTRDSWGSLEVLDKDGKQISRKNVQYPNAQHNFVFSPSSIEFRDAATIRVEIGSGKVYSKSVSVTNVTRYPASFLNIDTRGGKLWQGISGNVKIDARVVGAKLIMEKGKNPPKELRLNGGHFDEQWSGQPYKSVDLWMVDSTGTRISDIAHVYL